MSLKQSESSGLRKYINNSYMTMKTASSYKFASGKMFLKFVRLNEVRTAVVGVQRIYICMFKTPVRIDSCQHVNYLPIFSPNFSFIIDLYLSMLVVFPSNGFHIQIGTLSPAASMMLVIPMQKMQIIFFLLSKMCSNFSL